MTEILQTLYRPLRVGQSANRWNLAETESAHFPGIARALTDNVNYQFRNGWVATGDLPCREAWRKHIEERQIHLTDKNFPHVYIGAENPRVDFSVFCHQPTVVRRWARCSIRVAESQTLRFVARTCGGMRLWCDKVPALKHEPYTRNKPVEQVFELPVCAGEHELVVYLDELHERDTSCYFELQLLEGNLVETGLLMGSDAQRLAEAEAMMTGLRTTKVFHTDGAVCITSDALPGKPLQLTLKEDELIEQNQSPSAVLEKRQPARVVSIMLGRELPVATVMDINELVSGCPMMSWQCTVGEANLYRRIGTSVLANGVELPRDCAQERRELVLKVLVERMRKTPAHALVMLHQNQWDNHAQANLDLMLAIVQSRDDCADFHMMTLLWIATRYRSKLSSKNQRVLDETLLGFRYWLDEPGNDVMWFWSENHVLCFHVAQYLAGTLYENSVFSNSGKTGHEHAQQAITRLHQWFDSVDEHGLAEWNSAAYYPIDLRALVTLQVNAPDTSIVQRTATLIDRILTMSALHTLDGVPSGSQGRAYEKELLAGPATELGAVMAIAFGGWWYPGHDTAAAMLAVSDYRPPSKLDSLLKVPETDRLSAHYQQGLDGYAHLSLWKTADFQLSSVCNQPAGMSGHQQHLVDLRLAGHPYASVWVNHPGELQIWGEGRPSYWAGNGVLPKVAQHNEVVFMIYDLTLQKTDIGFTHLFCPLDVMDEINLEHPKWLFARLKKGYVAVFASGALEPVSSGLYAGSEWRLHADVCGWILIAGSEFEYGGFENFSRACLNRNPQFERAKRRLRIDARTDTDRDTGMDTGMDTSSEAGICMSNGEQPGEATGELSVSFDSPLYYNELAMHFQATTCEPQIVFAPLRGVRVTD